MQKNIIFWVLKKTKRRIPAIGVMTVANVGLSIFGVIFALNSRQVIDKAIAGDQLSFYKACLRQLLIIVGILVCITLFRILKEKVTANLDRDWKKELLHNLLHGEYTDVSEYHSGELINRMTNDVRVLNDGIVSIVPNLAAMITKLTAVAVVLIGLEPVFGVVIIGAGVLVMVLTGILRKRLKALNKEVSEADGRVSGIVQETLEKLLVVQAMDVSAEMERRTDCLMGHRFQAQMRRKNVSLFANTMVSILSYGASFGALVYASFGLLQGTVTFGELTALTQLVSQIQGPIVNMSGFYPKYVAMLAAAERLRELCNLEQQENPVPEEESVIRLLYEDMTHLGGENLSFTYDRNQVLNGASFCVPKGSFSVIVGSSGIGKSTLLKLLLGVYRLDDGYFYLKRQDESTCILSRNFHKLFAYVPQGNLLLSGTLRENLLLTKPDATEKEIARAVWVSHMEDYLAELPDGLDTVLRENAGGLSEGQAQRLSLARAILSDAPILLLDEATSALDEETEQKVLQRIKSLANRTCIMVTHRPAAMELCDYQLEIANGKIDRKI